MKVKTSRPALILLTLLIFSAVKSLAQQTINKDQIQNLINRNANRLGRTIDDLNGYRITDAYKDETTGLLFIYIQQTYKGYDVSRAIQTILVKDDSINYFAGGLFDTHHAGLNTYTAKPVVSAADAVIAALKYLNIPTHGMPVALRQKEENNEVEFGNLGIAQNNITAKLVWQPDWQRKRLTLIWQVQVQPSGSEDFWIINTDAVNAVVLGKENLTVKCSWSNGDNNIPANVFYPNTKTKNEAATFYSPADKINSAVYNVIKFPAASPSHPGGAPSVDTNPWERVLYGNGAIKYKWNADDFNVYENTRGNNVLAHEDVDNTNYNGKLALSATPIPDLTFSFTFDSTKEPTDSSNQFFAITNLFYWNNIMHDISYIYGFDEAAGNFQQNNRNASGYGNDFVYADAQDGATTNNASFLTPPDGQSPRMQLHLFNGTPKRDPDLDNEVICHEYTHGISNRFVGGPSSITCLQNEEQMGEGWSDYFALMITTNWAAAKTGDGANARPIGTYTLGQSPDGNGVRIHPYSTDTVIDPWTYTNLPDVPVYQGLPDPHAVGEIWCSALWDLTWALIDEEGITPNLYNTAATGGNIIAMKLVTLAMRLTPCSPGFWDGKKAILEADNKLFNNKYDCIIKKAFARRGMGAFFSQGSSLSYKDGIPDFTMPILAKIFPAPDKDTAAEGDQITYTLFVSGSACGGVTGYTITDTLPETLNYISGGNYNAATGTVNFNDIKLDEYERDTLYFTASVKGGTYYMPLLHINETVPDDSIPGNWQTYNIAANNTWVVNALSYSDPYAFFVSDPDIYSVSVLETKDPFLLKDKCTLSFWQSYLTENYYDGGVVEISTNNGETWIDMAPYFIQNGYTTTILGLYGSYLGGRKAFCGNSGGFIQTIANLDAFRGQYIKIRFLFASDEGGKSRGWSIDDIILKSEAAVFNKANIFNSSGDFIFSNDTATLILPGVLPKNWSSFTTEKKYNTSVLQWQYLQDVNTEQFIIERSADGTHFNAIGYVKAAEHAALNNNYTFTDHYPAKSSNFYRIQQVDKNGRVNYSIIRVLNFEADNPITVAPNPAKDKLIISIPNNTDQLQATLCNIAGQVIRTYHINGNSALLNLPHAAPGLYLLHITGKSFLLTYKILKE